MSQDTGSYYWLGFTPERQRDDSAHEIRVEMLRPGLKVRHRDTFQDFSRRAEVTMAVESGLLFGNAPSSRQIPLEVGKAKRAGVGTVEVPLRIGIPLDAVTVIPEGGRFLVQLELRVAVRSDDGATAEIPVVPIGLSSSEAPRPGAMGAFETSVKLRKGGQDLVVAVYDPASGALLSARQHIDV